MRNWGEFWDTHHDETRATARRLCGSTHKGVLHESNLGCNAPDGPTIVVMKAQCIITYQSSRASKISSWKTYAWGADHAAIAAHMIGRLRKRQRRRVTIIGVMVHDKDAAAAAIGAVTRSG